MTVQAEVTPRSAVIMRAALRAVFTALIAAVEAVAVALAGFVVVAIPLLLVWWLAFDLDAEPEQMLVAATGGWLLAHGVPLTFSVGPELALSFGLAPEQLEFTISLIPLGLTALTVGLAARVGWRLAGRTFGASGLLGGTLGFGVAAWIAAGFSGAITSLSPWIAALIPALFYAVSASLGYLLRLGIDEDPRLLTAVSSVQRRFAPPSSPPFWQN